MQDGFEQQTNSKQIFNEHVMENSEPYIVERNASANEPVITKTIPNTGKKFNGQIKIQLEQIKINEFNSQAKPILAYWRTPADAHTRSG